MDKLDAESVIRDTIEYANNEIRKSKARAKRAWIICVLAVILIAAVLFFPAAKTWSISGHGQIRNMGMEPTADCEIEIEVRELRSLVLRYQMDFTFTLDGEVRYRSADVRFPAPFSVTESGDLMITQFYYAENTNSMEHCTLFCQGDRSSASVFLNNRYYTLDVE